MYHFLTLRQITRMKDKAGEIERLRNKRIQLLKTHESGDKKAKDAADKMLERVKAKLRKLTRNNIYR